MGADSGLPPSTLSTSILVGQGLSTYIPILSNMAVRVANIPGQRRSAYRIIHRHRRTADLGATLALPSVDSLLMALISPRLPWNHCCGYRACSNQREGPAG